MKLHPTILFASILLLLGASRSAAQALAPDEARIRRASELLHVATSEIEAADVATFRFRTLGLEVLAAKAVLRTGESVSKAVDQFGRSVDLSALRRAEVQARSDNPEAKFDPPLARALAEDPHGVHPLIAWLRFDAADLDAQLRAIRESVDPAKLSTEEVRALEEAAMARVEASNRLTVQRASTLLREAGARIRQTSRFAPVIFFDGNRDLALAVAGLPEVDTLYRETADSVDYNIDANATHRTDRVHAYGVRGRNIRVAMLEDNGIDPACPYLVVSGWFNAGTPNPDNHIHGTAGCVASRLASRIGSAPDVSLFSANAASYSDSNVTAAGDWIATQNIDITNGSFGPTVPTGNLRYVDRYIDYQARFTLDSYVFAAGNSGIGSFVGNVGWNMISVGSHTDNGNGDWTGDVMSTFSATANPSTGCEKPNLAANGQDVDTLGEGPGWLTNDYNGTSFAAPHVTGNLANAMVVSSVLQVFPEAALPAVMATAWHNIEGASRLSDQDGAGGLHGLALFRMTSANRVAGFVVTPTSFNNNGYRTHSIWLQGGDRARVAIGWFSNANSAYTTDVLDADLDITILAGLNVTSGTSFGSSASFNNNFEIVEFTPPSTGWYTVRINDFRFDGASEGVGVVWSQKYADTSHFRLREWTSEFNLGMGPTIGNASYYMDPVAPTSPLAPFLSVPSATMVNGFSFSAQTWSPLDWDIWTQLFVDLSANPVIWFGFTGNLSSSGTWFSNRIAIPDAAWLAGHTVYHVALTVDSAYPDSVKEISEVHPVKFLSHGVAKTLSDDSTVMQSLPFGFRFYGVDYTQCWINSNGNITFGGGDTDFTETAAEMLSGRPRIAFFWDDLNPAVASSQGSTRVMVREVFQNAQQMTVEFVNVPEFSTTNANTARVTLGADNTIKIEYRDCALQDCIVGISPGNGLSSASSVDLSSQGWQGSGSNQALFQVFTASDPFDLRSPNIYWNELRFVPTSPAAVSYRMFLDIDR
jgi:hypothetical protein